MSTYTDSLGLEEITPGDQAGLWGNTTNNNLALIDQAVTGVTPIDFTGASGTVKILDAANGALNEARAAVLNITGIATGPNTVVVPNKQKMYLVRNDSGQDVIFRTASPNATYTVEAGNSILIFCDNNNNVFTGIQAPSSGTLSVSAGGTGATTFTAGFIKSTGGTNALTSSGAINLNSSDTTGTLPVTKGGTGQTTLASGAILTGNGTGAIQTMSAGSVGQALVSNGSTYGPASIVNSITAGSGITITGGSTGNLNISATGGTSGVSSVSASSPLFSSGGSNPNISISSSPTFGTSVTTPIYYLGNSPGSMYIQNNGGEMGFVVSGLQTAKVTNAGFGCTTLAVSNRTSLGGGSAGNNFVLDVAGFANQTVAFFTTTGTGGNGIAINAVSTPSLMLFRSNNVDVGSITTSAGSTFYNTTSDRRLKTNITALTNSGAVIDALKPRQFTWSSTGATTNGFIADELQQVLPNTVRGDANAVDKDGNPVYQQIDAATPEMIALMIAELQSLRKRVAELEAK